MSRKRGLIKTIYMKKSDQAETNAYLFAINFEEYKYKIEETKPKDWRITELATGDAHEFYLNETRAEAITYFFEVLKYERI